MNEMPALDKPCFESHLEMTELDLCCSGCRCNDRQSKQFEKTSQLCCAFNCEMVGTSKHIYLSSDFLEMRTGASSGGLTLIVQV